MPKYSIILGSCLLVAAMCFIVLARGNLDEDSVRLAIRLTAATSFALLLCAFTVAYMGKAMEMGSRCYFELVQNKRQLLGKFVHSVVAARLSSVACSHVNFHQ